MYIYHNSLLLIFFNVFFTFFKIKIWWFQKNSISLQRQNDKNYLLVLFNNKRD